MTKKLNAVEAFLLVTWLRLTIVAKWLKDPWSPKTEKRLTVITFVVIIPLVLISIYTWESMYCSVGVRCAIANADWANWLFGKK